MTAEVQRPVDLAILDADVLTLDERVPRARAIGVRGGRVAAVGDEGDVLALADDATRIVRAGRATVVPGLVDGHAHLDREGLREVFPTLAGLRSLDAVLARIGRLAADRPAGEWLVTMPLGDPPYYEDPPGVPDRWQLDAVAGGTPVFIRPIWGYWRHRLPITSVFNSAALRILGPGFLRRCEEFADVERDAGGEPTGRVHERVFEPTLELMLPDGIGRFDQRTRRAALASSMRRYAAVGTTGVYEGHGVVQEVETAYRELADTGAPMLRARLPLSLPWLSSTAAERAALRSGPVRRVAGRGDGDDRLRFVGLSLGSAHGGAGRDLRAAARPYTGWAGFDYESGLTGADLLHELVECARAKVQVAAMTPDMLDVYEQVDQVVPLRGLRWVLGHINVLSPRDIARIKRLGLVVTTHTNRYLYKEGSIGERAEGGRPVPLRSLIEAGVPVSLGTDNVPISLFSPVWHATARCTRDGVVVTPEERISRLAALRCATAGGAALTFEEGWRGRLVPGYAADLAVLSDDPLSVEESRLPALRSVLTVVGGRIVHDET
ncbi:amidohydrolase [Actinokineospora sp. NPDC004072]